jgi:hypothetical protein
MAEVQYKHEPTVSVHGIPKAEYEANVASQQPATTDVGGGDTVAAGGDVEGGGQQYTGIAGHFRRHWVMYSLGLAAAGVFVAYLAYRNSQNNSYAVTAGNSATGQVGTPSTIDSSWGSQLDADYQQLTSVETTNTGLLQSILNGITGGTTTPPSSPTPPAKGPVAAGPKSPIMGSQGIYNPMIGQQFSFEGILYQLVPGPSGRVWGVQEQQGHPYSNQQLEQAPIGLGVGAKRLLTAKG